MTDTINTTWPVKMLPDAKVVARIAEVLQKVRQCPSEPRAAYAEGLPSVMLVHQDIWNQLLGCYEQLQMLKQAIHEQGLSIMGTPGEDFPPTSWQEPQKPDPMAEELARTRAGGLLG